MTKKDGSEWHGLAIMAGLPATIAAALVAAPIAIPLALATYAAKKRGDYLDAESALDRAIERQRMEESASVAREPELRARRVVWDGEYEALYTSHENGEITEEEFDREFDILVDRYPRDD